MRLLDVLGFIAIACFVAYLVIEVFEDTFVKAWRVEMRQRRQGPPPLPPRPFDWQKDLDA